MQNIRAPKNIWTQIGDRIEESSYIGGIVVPHGFGSSFAGYRLAHSHIMVTKHTGIRLGILFLYFPIFSKM